MPDTSVPDASAALGDRVLAAMTTGMATADGEPVVACLGAAETPSEVVVEYRHGDAPPRTVVDGGVLAAGAPLATRRYRVDERDGTVELRSFTLATYEERYNGYRNAIAIHERFLENLAAGGAGTPCLLWTAVAGNDVYVWVPYYDWTPGMHFANTANLERAVESLYEIVKGQSVWDARDLPERVRRIGEPHPDRVPGEPRSWRQLIDTTTPAQLAEGLDAINPGLARVVFTQMGTWYGQRAIPAGWPAPARQNSTSAGK